MRVLVTGGSGYMGSVLTSKLLQEGHYVRVLDSLMHGGQGILPLYGHERFNFVHGDIRDSEIVEKALQQMEAVVHLAAIVGDPACAKSPQIAKDVNQQSALSVFGLARRIGIERFIFASTCSNYGRMTDPTKYLDEDAELKPVSLYAETKVAVEHTILDSQGEDVMASTVLRFATLFGLSPRMRFDLTVNTFTMELMAKEELEIYGEQFWRPYVHVSDAANAILKILNAPIETIRGQVYNVGDTNENYTKRQLADLIDIETGVSHNITYVKRDEDPRDYRVTFGKIKEQLGFEITRTVPAGIQELVDAIKQGVITDFDNPKYYN